MYHTHHTNTYPGIEPLTMPQPTNNHQDRTIQLVAVDLDGTLLDSDKRLSPRVENAIRQVSTRGVHVVIASARPPRTVRNIYTSLKLDTLQINYNGALIQDPPTGKHIHYQPLDGKLALNIANHARTMLRDVLVSVEILDRWYTDRFDEQFVTETSRLFLPDVIAPLGTFLNQPITKLMLLASPEPTTRLYHELTCRYAGKVRLVMCDDYLIQIVHPSVNKGDALARIADYYRIGSKFTMAIGDAPNDIDMFDYAGLSIAVENAWPMVKDKADVVVPSNDQDGVAVALERYILNCMG